MEEKKKVRIMHVAQAAGGVDRYLRMLLKYLDKDEYENIMVCSSDYLESDYFGLSDGFCFVDMGRSINLKKDIKSILRVRKLIKEYNPDIIYGHSSKGGAVARIANIGLKKYCLYNPHGWAFNMRCSKIKQYVYATIERNLARFCDIIVCISDAEKESAIRRHICSETKLQVIFNGVDIDHYIKSQRKDRVVTRESLGIPEGAFIIGTSGRLSDQKAPDVFIHVAKQIKELIPEAYFIMVGDGELKSQILNYAKENGLEECILITGWVREPMEYVNLFDVATLLSRWEGFGLVLPEYMMAGKPIIASNVDAIPNIIQNEINGLLVKPNDEKDILQAILEIYYDSSLYNKLAHNGKKIVNDRFNVKRVATEHEMIINKIRVAG